MYRSFLLYQTITPFSNFESSELRDILHGAACVVISHMAINSGGRDALQISLFELVSDYLLADSVYKHITLALY